MAKKKVTLKRKTEKVPAGSVQLCSYVDAKCAARARGYGRQKFGTGSAYVNHLIKQDLR